MNFSKDIKYVGVNDYDIDLFEGQYIVPNGMSYNSYVVLDDKISVFDAVDARFSNEWINNIKSVIGDKTPEYLIIQHMEPDHSGSITAFTDIYPDTKIVSSDKSFKMMKNYFGTDFNERQIVVAEGDVIKTGKHEFVFVNAPMVHWPEVIVTYDKTEKVLFSADGFGKFGALDADEDWACEARRYYIGIVGKYGMQVQSLLKKAAALDIKTICPLHGPILTENLGYYINLYDIWSSYGVESDGIVIAYTSVYGNTKKAVEKLKGLLEERGVQKVVLTDLARSDMAENVEDAFRYGKLVLATTTYNGEIFPFMRDFIAHLVEHNYQNRTVAFIENGSWAPVAAKVMRGLMEKCKNITYAENSVKIMSALSDDSNAQLVALADELCK
ncbi:MAG: FprA family A-type flavoprotein [Clostridia bacterium]|nr:FprA family A-type flavoprotein [Clostridia bacterium]